MVSLGYMMIFFLKGGLPWKGLLELKTNDYYRRVSEMVLQNTILKINDIF